MIVNDFRDHRNPPWRVYLAVLLFTFALISSAWPAWYDSYDFAADGCVAYWPLESDATDVTGNNNNGVPHGDTAFVAGHLGNAASFDGDLDGIKISLQPDFANACTWSVWVMVHDTSDNNFYAMYKMANKNYGQYGINYYPSSGLINVVAEDMPSGSAAIQYSHDLSRNTWHHLCATIQSGEQKLYLNGELKATANHTGVLDRGSFIGLYLGGPNESGTYIGPVSMDGKIDDAVIFNRVLSAEEVSALASDVDGNGIADFWVAADLPQVFITTPASDTEIPNSQNSFDFSGTASDASTGTVTQVQYRINGGIWQPASGTANWSCTVSGLAEGENLVEVRALDNGSNYSPIDSRAITRDLGLPSLVIGEPGGNATIPFGQSSFEFSGTAADDSALVSIEYKVNSGTWSMATGTTNWTFTATGLSVGTNSISVRAIDDRDNYSSEAHRIITREDLITSQEPEWERVWTGTVENKVANIYTPGTRLSAVEFGDIDDDGDMDLFVGGWRYCQFHRNDGTPQSPVWTFVDANYFNLPQSDDAAYAIPELADIDDDGDLDMFIGAWQGNIRFYRNYGTPSEPNFQLETTSFEGIHLSKNAAPRFVDMDTDGDLDLIVGRSNIAGSCNPYEGRMHYYENQRVTTGTWSFVETSNDYSGMHTYYCTPCFEDIDNDGDYDMFQSGNLCGDVGRVWFKRNLGTPENPVWGAADTEAFSFLTDVYTRGYLAFLDYDGDGDRDLVYSRDNGFIQFYERTGTPGEPVYTERESFLSSLAKTMCYPTFADMDGDGDQDFLYSNEDEMAFMLIENQGTVFAPRWSRPQPQNIPYPDPSGIWFTPELGDLDQDGDADMVVGYNPTYGGDGAIALYENVDGIISLTNASLFTVSGGSWLIPELCDMDNDGDMDLLLGVCKQYSMSPPQLYFYSNEAASPQDTPIWNLESTNYVQSSNTGTNGFIAPNTTDIDRDGDLDLFLGVGVFWFNSSYGQVNYFQNVGDSNTPIWDTRVENYLGINSMSMPYPSFVDIDDDGDEDFFFSDEVAGVMHWSNNAEKLSIYPQVSTVVAGHQQELTLRGTEMVSTWTILRNESGATLSGAGDSVTYNAGNFSGVMDVVEVYSDSGLSGRVHVNVISEADLSASGKAVVLAGRKANDPLWETTNELAHFVYRMLLYRGFSPENVLYLNPETDQDVNGDGDSGNDIDLPSTHANIQEGLTNFASGSPNLFVYLIDHGDADPNGENGFIRCNESDVLYAAELDDWLDNLQAHHGVTTLTLVVDCCTAGAFLKDCAGAPTGCNRVVVCSSGATQPSVFTAGGLISFTHAFVNALYSGLPLGHAFDLGAGAMDRYQQPIMDDDGDGIYNKDLDGTVADALTVGASYIAGADRPQIGNIVPNQTLSGGNTEATLWASGVSGVYPVERVWATIAEPGLIGRAQLDPSNPISNLPEVDLTWNETNQRYEATTNTFTSLGAYAVNFYAKDIWGGIAFPKQTYIAQGESDEEGIILCGDGDYDSNSPWAYSDYLAGAAYETMRSRWIKPDRIQYLSSGSRTGIDDTPTEDHLSSAIAAAVGQSQVTLYMVGRGSAGAFDVDGDGVASDADDVTPAELDAMLDALQTAEPTSPTRVVVVLDFTESGDWTAPLKAPAGKERIIVTSCRAGQKSWCEEGGVLSFSRWFLSQVFNGANVRDAFNWSRTALYTITGYTQLATLDDDGSGRADRGDGTLAFETYIGAAFVTGSEAPEIGSVAEIGPLSGTSETLWAAAIRSAAGLDEVFAYVVRPGADAENDAMDRVDLAYDSAAGRWEASYDQFDPSLHQDIIYFAVDRDGQISEPVSTHVEPSGSEDLYDRLFNDDTTETLNFFSEDNWEQTHNFWAPGDEDWAIFNADAGQSYEIRVRNQAINCDGAIALYHESDLETPLVEWDFWGPGGADEILVWDSNATTGTIFVKVSQSPYSSHLNGSATTYTLQVFSGWGANAGLATISGTLVYMSANSAGGTLNVSSEGYYSANSLSIPPGALTEPAEFLIRSPGDSGNYPYFPSTQMWQNAHPHSASIMQVLSTLEETPLDSFFLTMEFLDGVTADNGFLIDDVPDGFPTSKMRIFWWTGEQWEIVPGVQTVVGNTVSVYLNQLGPTLLDSYLFAVGPGPLETREVAFSLPNSTVSETDSSCEVEVVVSASAAHNETFTYTTEGTAQSGEDYTTLSGSLVLEDGKTTAVITVTLNNDVHVEENETLELTLTGGNEGTLPGSPDRHILTIESEDVPDSGNSLVPTVRWMLYE